MNVIKFKKKNINKFIFLNINISQTYNNFFINLSTKKGKVIFSISGGYSKLKGSKRKSIRSAEIISKIFINKIKALKNFANKSIKFSIILKSSPNPIVNTFINLIVPNFNFFFFIELIKIPHNGLRGKLIRRVLIIYIYILKRNLIGKICALGV